MEPTAISLKGGTKVICTNDQDEKLANWVAKGYHGEEVWSNMHVTKLRYMNCPGCSNRIEVNKLKLVKGAQFSNITCNACNQMSNSRCWKCDCNQLWHKCCVHVKGYDENKQVEPKTNIFRRKKFAFKGIDKPLPCLRMRCNEKHAVELGRCKRDYFRISLPPGSRLALRFPHLVKKCEDGQMQTVHKTTTL